MIEPSTQIERPALKEQASLFSDPVSKFWELEEAVDTFDEILKAEEKDFPPEIVEKMEALKELQAEVKELKDAFLLGLNENVEYMETKRKRQEVLSERNEAAEEIRQMAAVQVSQNGALDFDIPTQKGVVFLSGRSILDCRLNGKELKMRM